MSYTEDRRLEEKEQRRNEIVDAAETVFARDGIEAATLGAVGKQARLSRSLIYVYFKDKEDLACAVTQRGLRLLRDRFAGAAARHERGIDQLQAIGRAYFEFVRAYPVYFNVLMRWESREVEFGELTENEASCMVESNRVFEVMIRAIEQGRSDGSIAADAGDPMEIAVSLWAFTHGLVQIATYKERMLKRVHDVDSRRVVDRAFELMMRGLRP